MDSELKFVEGQPFYYQIGEVTTITPWWRPTHDRIYKFLTQEEVVEILQKYVDVQIIGNCLWDFDITWDLDLRLILPPYNEELNPPDWNSIEDDINKLNNLALNEWRILPDIGVTPNKHTLPSRKSILERFESGSTEIKVDEFWIAKIAYTRKVVGDQSVDYDIRNSNRYYTESLTDRYLTRYFPNYHAKKIVDKILNSKNDYLESAISLDRFLEMSEEEFIKFQNA